MKRFNFRLEPILRHRILERNQAMIELFAEKKKLDELMNKLHEIRVAAKQEIENIAKRRGLLKNAYELLWMQTRMDFYRSMDLEIRNEIEQQKHAIRNAKNNLFNKDQEVKRIEKIKEKQYSYHFQMAKKMEEKTIDEIVVINHARRGGKGGIDSIY